MERLNTSGSFGQAPALHGAHMNWNGIQPVVCKSGLVAKVEVCHAYDDDKTMILIFVLILVLEHYEYSRFAHALSKTNQRPLFTVSSST